MSEQNLALLTQQEIDTLVNFLTEKKNEMKGEIDNETLNQMSIDKLIGLLHKKDTTNLRMDKIFLEEEQAVEEKILFLYGFAGADDVCELTVEVEADGMLVIQVTNQTTGLKDEVNPDQLACRNMEKTDAKWGKCIAPVLFDKVASVLGARYTKETYEKVCEIFSEVMFGSKDVELPQFYIQDAETMLKHLL